MKTRILAIIISSLGLASSAWAQSIAGLEAEASGEFSVANGYRATASGGDSTAIGGATVAGTTVNAVNGGGAVLPFYTPPYNYTRQTSVGVLALSYGPGDSAFGSSATAISNPGPLNASSYKMTAATALGNYSAAWGMGNTAVGSSSHAGRVADQMPEWDPQLAAFGATAIGASSAASGSMSVAAGFEAGVSADNGVAVGSLAFASQSGAVAIGFGSRAQATNAVALGSGTVADQADTVAVGGRRIVQMADGIGIADGVTVGQMNATIAPVAATANAAYTQLNSSTVNIGAGSAAYAPGAVAIGQGSMSIAYNSVALGAGSVATRDNTVDVGGRQITGVAAPTAGTDAANKAYVDAQIATVGGADMSGINSRIDSLQNRIEDVRKEANGGVALALAASNPVALAPGESAVGVGTGAYGNQSAVALTIAHNLQLEPRESNRIKAVTFSGGLGATTAGNVGMRAGVNFTF